MYHVICGIRRSETYVRVATCSWRARRYLKPHIALSAPRGHWFAFGEGSTEVWNAIYNLQITHPLTKMAEDATVVV